MVCCAIAALVLSQIYLFVMPLKRAVFGGEAPSAQPSPSSWRLGMEPAEAAQPALHRVRASILRGGGGSMTVAVVVSMSAALVLVVALGAVSDGDPLRALSELCGVSS